MPIQNYPRFLTKASKTAQQLQTGLPIVGSDGVSGDFNTLKINTDGSINVAGGGGGDATASNQLTQITEAQTTNGYLVSPNLVPVGSLLESTSAVSVANLLETGGGTSIATVSEAIDTKTTKIQKYSQWNTYTSKVFYNASGLNTFNIDDAVKIVFNSNNIEITAFTDQNGLSILGDYFVKTGTSYLANNGSEVISNGNSSGDLFKDITIQGSGHFTVYYLITPYVTP